VTNHQWPAGRARFAGIARVLAVLGLAVGSASAATPPVEETELLNLGFKVLVATTDVQQKWVRNLPPGKIRPMQRTGKKYFIYPDAARNRIYVGGPAEYDAYTRAHPAVREAAQHAKDAAIKESARRGRDATTMQSSSARDASNPFLGATWADLGW
jgi:hypothetical protein